jgi:hypothetical protein
MHAFIALSIASFANSTWSRLLSGAIGALFLAAAAFGLRDYRGRHRKH